MTEPSSDDELASYSFELPEAQIAQRPLAERGDARLLALTRDAPAPAHLHVRELVDVLRAGDLLVVNDTTVIPARLYGEKAATGGKLELLLVRTLEAPSLWACLVQSSKKPKAGTRLVFAATDAGAPLRATVEANVSDEPGVYAVRFDDDPLPFSRAHGHVPLPPYIARADDAEDVARYQTVFHDPRKPGSSAAPTAGLHFDDALLRLLEKKGVLHTRVTLHVGPGTFLPVRGDRLREHVMHPEPWVVSPEAARSVNETRARGGRVVAVGTTSLRCLESAADAQGVVHAGQGLTRLFITPGYRFRVVDALVTNFHLPASTLFVLVCALAGKERMRAAYAEAIAHGYRFYSYGDASFLERL